MKLSLRILVFIVLNFAALLIGGLFTGDGVSSDWYSTLEKAPWTPPGWVFGFAWTSIMVCYAIYMGILYNRNGNRKEIILLYSIQLLLNISWNPIFFYFQNAILALVVIVLLTILVISFLFKYRKENRGFSLFILPYCLWLCIATSLNLYVVIFN